MFRKTLRLFRAASTAPDPTGLSQPFARAVAGLKRLKDGAQHFVIGHHTPDPGVQGVKPFYLHRSLVNAHGWYLGATDSGKTSQGFMPLLIQLIREGALLKASGFTPHPIIVIDLKPDWALFHTAKYETDLAGLPFHYFRPEQDWPSHYFNPLETLSTEYRTPVELTGIMMQALSLTRPEDQGEQAFFAGKNDEALTLAISSLTRPNSLQALQAPLERLVKLKAHQHATHVLTKIRRLAQVPALNPPLEPSAATNRTINMTRLLQEGGTAYFFLRSLQIEDLAKDIARLALWALVIAAAERNDNRLPPRQAYLFIDEFHELVGRQIARFLALTREYRIAAKLANQSISQLRYGPLDITNDVINNVGYCHIFSAWGPEDALAIQKMSGEASYILRAFSVSQSEGYGLGTDSQTTRTHRHGTSAQTMKGEGRSLAETETREETIARAVKASFAYSRSSQSSEREGYDSSQSSRSYSVATDDQRRSAASRAAKEEHTRRTEQTTGTADDYSIAEAQIERRTRTGQESATLSLQERIAPAVDPNMILDVSYRPGLTLFQARRPAGRTDTGGRFAVVRTMWPLPLDVYRQRLEQTPWPEPRRSASLPPPTKKASLPASAVLAQPGLASLQERVLAIIAAREKKERAYR